MREFLNKYNTVIFDMDGVITSEEKYWDAAALTVWEYLRFCRNESISAPECMANVNEIRKTVFCEDELIKVLKNKGLNSNWDLGYVTVLMAWILKTEEYSKILDYAKTLPDNIMEGYEFLAKECAQATGYDYKWLCRNELMWKTMQGIFQEWYLGDRTKGKSGLRFNEEPIVDKAELCGLLKDMSKTHRLCTGTGRPWLEMKTPLEEWGIMEFFAPDGLSNYDHVKKAEEKFQTSLVKPHPYMFLKALYGTDYDDKKIVEGDYDKTGIKKTLVVGDAGSDILAAQAMGADFCAVLTGVAGKSARGYFEKMNAQYILDSVLDFN